MSNKTARDFLEDASQYAGVSGSKPDSPMAISTLNKALRLLWSQGDWEGTMITGFLRLERGCFYLCHPAEIIKNVYQGQDNNPVPIYNGHTAWSNLTDMSNCCKGGKKYPFFRTANTAVIPSFPKDSQLGLVATNCEDAETEIVVAFKYPGGITSEKLTLLPDWEPVFTEQQVDKVIAITKKETKGDIDVVSRMGGGMVKNVFKLASDDCDPCYQQYMVKGCPSDCCIVLRAKRKVPKISNLDMPIHLNEDALEFAMLAVSAKEKGNNNGYVENLSLARDHLQLEKEDFTNSITPSREVIMGDMIISSPYQYDCI